MGKVGVLIKVLFLVAAFAGVFLLITSVRSGFAAEKFSAGEGKSFFEQFVLAGGPIVWFVLLPMSVIMLSLVVEYSLSIRRRRLVPAGVGDSIIKKLNDSGIARLDKRLSDKDDMVSAAITRAVVQGRGDWFRMRSILAESLQEQAGGLLRKIEWINLIGNVSPMVGLFGTVFGMIKLFNAIVLAGGQPQPSQLAEGISVALVTTFWGLLIAIPAVGVYGVFVNRIETLAGDAVSEAEIVLDRLREILRHKQLQRQQLTQKVPIIDYKEKTSKISQQDSLQDKH